jgi:hypothetical protein
MTVPQSHEDLVMSGTARVTVACPPDVAYAALTDLARMGEWSPENRGGEWIDGTPGEVGALFRGRNHDGRGGWETICHVIEADAPHRFAFRVATPGEEGTIWRFAFEPDGTGTAVTESFEWRWTREPDEGFRGRVGRMSLPDATAIVAGREQQLRAAIGETIAAFKDAIEASPG